MYQDLAFYKDFKPDLTPKEMLEHGVFGGSYLGNTMDEYPLIFVFVAPPLGDAAGQRGQNIISLEFRLRKTGNI